MSLKEGIKGLFRDMTLGENGKRLAERIEKTLADEEDSGMLNDLLDEIEERGKGRRGK